MRRATIVIILGLFLLGIAGVFHGISTVEKIQDNDFLTRRLAQLDRIENVLERR